MMLEQLKSMLAQPIPSEQSSDRDRLVLEHLPQIKHVAQRIHSRVPKGIELDDLIGAGIVGLLDAVAKFRPEKGVKFKTYAAIRIRGAVLDSLRTLDWAPRRLRQKSRSLKAAVCRLEQRGQRQASNQEIADEMQIGLPDFFSLLNDLKCVNLGIFKTVSTHLQNSQDDGNVRHYPFVPMPSPYHSYEKKELESQMANAIRNLTLREKEILSFYYIEELTMKEIGEVMGVTESRICQMHARVVARLRAALSRDKEA